MSVLDQRTYHIITGSRRFFEEKLPMFTDVDDVHTLIELVKLSDAAQENKGVFEDFASILLVRNDDYHGIVDSAHDRLGALIEEVTADDADIYVHNPPQKLKNYLLGKAERNLIVLTTEEERYDIRRDSAMFQENMRRIGEDIIGQENAIEEMGKSLWYLTTVKRKKPYVIMLHGNSSLGKTELVREVAERFFDGKFLEKHLSMFQNNNYSNYFFGDVPSRRSIGYDLLERESNLIFFDELDKCPEHYYSAFYTLFDDVLFKDAAYEVDVSGTIIVVTSNYQTREEMKKRLGLPIYYRIDKFIHFADLTETAIRAIVDNEVRSRLQELDGRLSFEQITASVAPLIDFENENARTIKYKVQHVIEELLFSDLADAQ